MIETGYKVGGTLPPNHPTYVERQADTELYERLLAGQYCYVLNSRQMGKSSLRVRTKEKLAAQDIICLDVDLSAIGSKVSSEQWYASIANSLMKEIYIGDTFNWRTWWQEQKLLSPSQRLNELISNLILESIKKRIVIFIDEIDFVLNLGNFTDDFFVLIRAYYNQRANNQQYNRLSFCLLGVGTPSDLIENKEITPFNIGCRIPLNGFTIEEAELPLTQGLVGKVDNPQEILEDILFWTGGQSFLTQKLCNLVLEKGETRNLNVSDIVRKYLIRNWESQDEPQHLRTIRDRLLKQEQRAVLLLGKYQEIWHKGAIIADGSKEQQELLLSGIVVKDDGKLTVFNSIYQEIFNNDWIERELAKLRPYSAAITAWLNSHYQDESRLLRGQALADALAWKKGKSLGDMDHQFLEASQQLEQRETEISLAIETEAKQKANKRISIGSVILFISFIGTMFLGLWANQSFQRLQQAREGIKLEREATTAWQQFEFAQLDALLSAMEIGQRLQSLVKDNRSLEEYPAINPLLTLQRILHNIREQNQIRINQSEVNTISFSPDGKYIATGDRNGKVNIWNLSGQKQSEFNAHEGQIFNLSFSPDGEKIATFGEDGTLAIWNLSGQQQYKTQAHENIIYSVSFSPDGEKIATAHENGTVAIWNLSGEQLAKFKGHRSSVYSVNFSPDGEHIAAGSKDGTVLLWHLSGEILAQFNGHQREIYKLRFSPDGQKIATASLETIRLWNLSGEQQFILYNDSYGFNDISFSPDGQQIVTTGKDGDVIVWSISGEQLAQLKNYQTTLSSRSFIQDEKQLITASNNGKVTIWNLAPKQFISWQSDLGRVIDASPNINLILIASEDGTTRLLNFSGKQLNKLESWVASVDFSSNGQLMATAEWEEGVKLWNLSGEIQDEFGSYQSLITDINFSPDGQLIATVDEEEGVKLWNLSGEVKDKFGSRQTWINDINFSPDGQLIATADEDGKIEIWNRFGKQQGSFQADSQWLTAVNFSPNGKQLFTASQDGTVKLWSLSGKQQGIILAHQGEITHMSFSPDGQLFATAGLDDTVKLWLLSGQQLAQFDRQDSVTSLSFTTDGKEIIVGNADGKIWLLPVPTLDKLLEEGCQWLEDYLRTHDKQLEACSEQ